MYKNKELVASELVESNILRSDSGFLQGIITHEELTEIDKLMDEAFIDFDILCRE